MIPQQFDQRRFSVDEGVVSPDSSLPLEIRSCFAAVDEEHGVGRAAPVLVFALSLIPLLSSKFGDDPIKVVHCTSDHAQTNTSPYAHTRTFFSLRTPHVIARLAQGLTILCVSRKVISSLFMSLLNVPSTPFHPIFSSPTTTPTPLTKPVRDSALGWTVWPPGRSDSKHRLRAQILHRCQ